MDQRQHAWLQTFLGVPVPLPVDALAVPGPGTGAFPDDSIQTHAPSGDGQEGSSAPPPPPTLPPPAAPPKSGSDKADTNVAVTGFIRRYKAINHPDQTFETAAANRAYAAAFNALVDARKAQDYAKAVTLIGPAETALKTLEAAVADLPNKERAAKAEVARIKQLGDAELTKLASADRAAIVRTLLGAGQPNPDARAAQIRLYNTAQIDPAFTKEDEKRGQAIADELKANTALRQARDGWGKSSPEDKVKVLERIVAVQSKHLGISAPRVIIDPKLSTKAGTPGKTLTVHGKFDETDGQLHVNMHPDSDINDFQKAIALVLHENAHHYQIELVARLQDRRLKPGDPEYAQAQMFAANRLVPGGYVPDSESFSDYEKQPIEAQSNATSKPLAQKIVAGLGSH